MKDFEKRLPCHNCCNMGCSFRFDDIGMWSQGFFEQFYTVYNEQQQCWRIGCRKYQPDQEEK